MAGGFLLPRNLNLDPPLTSLPCFRVPSPHTTSSSSSAVDLYFAASHRITTMPASISYSSVPPKFPDKQRRPGIIQLPQPLTSLTMAQHHQKRNSLGSLPPPVHLAKHHKLAAQSQLRTPEPSPRRKNNQQQRSGSPPHRQSHGKQQQQQQQQIHRPAFKHSAHPRAPTPPSPGSVFELPSFEFPKRNAIDPAPITPLSPPPTPVPEHRKKLRAKPGLSLAKLPHVSLASPLPSPSVYKVITRLSCLSTLHFDAYHFPRFFAHFLRLPELPLSPPFPMRQCFCHRSI